MWIGMTRSRYNIEVKKYGDRHGRYDMRYASFGVGMI